ncbi:hypothetical protein, partial [Escherichia coli]|uniref:hypothetical protein n=1 Tax=Escherichia coli TaxID=562 RepID=UPI001CDAF0DD
ARCSIFELKKIKEEPRVAERLSDTNIRSEPFRLRLKQIIFIIVVMFIIAINSIDNRNAILIAFAAFFSI